MSEDAAGGKISSRCPSCGQVYMTRPEQGGQWARCRKCGTTFTLAKAAQPQPAPQGPIGGGDALCAICQTAISPDDEVTRCDSCKAAYHAACWEYNKGCAVYGCSKAPPTEQLSQLEIPMAYWGNEEKECPKCGRTILAAATRCRHCGATFASQAPETSLEYHRRAIRDGKSHALRQTGIVLLVLGVLTCTAPIAAIIGVIWYARNREAIRALPGLYAAVCKIAVGIAVGQTVLIVIFMLIHVAAG